MCSTVFYEMVAPLSDKICPTGRRQPVVTPKRRGVEILVLPPLTGALKRDGIPDGVTISGMKFISGQIPQNGSAYVRGGYVWSYRSALAIWLN